MAHDAHSPLREAHALFAARVKYLRETLGISQAQAGAEMKRRGMGKAQKTLSNIERKQHDARLTTFAANAAQYGVPLWMMFLPGLENEMLHGEKAQRFRSLVDSYLRSTDEQRQHIENMAAGFAAMNPKK